MTAIRTEQNKSHDLGSSTRRFDTLFVGSIDADGPVVLASTLTVGGNIVQAASTTALNGQGFVASTITAPTQSAVVTYVEDVNLQDLKNVTVTSPAEGHLVTYDNATSLWVNRAPDTTVTDSLSTQITSLSTEQTSQDARITTLEDRPTITEELFTTPGDITITSPVTAVTVNSAATEDSTGGDKRLSLIVNGVTVHPSYFTVSIGSGTTTITLNSNPPYTFESSDDILVSIR